MEFDKIVLLLAEAGVEFVIVGGLASQMHGGSNVTFDVDVAIFRSRENSRALVQAPSPYHPKPVDWPEGLPFVWDEQMVMNCSLLTLQTAIGRIDVLADPEGSPPYKVLESKAIAAQLGNHTIRYASIDDLISMKTCAGRQKDIEHIAQLETLRRLQKERP